MMKILRALFICMVAAVVGSGSAVAQPSHPVKNSPPGLNGLYVRLVGHVHTSPKGYFLEPEEFQFEGNSHVTFGTPPTPGSYRIAQSRITLTTAAGATRTMSFRRVANGILLDNILARRMTAFTAGSRLSGTYAYYFNPVDGTYASENENITFQSNGTFASTDVGLAPDDYENGVPKNRITGTYSLLANTLTLRHASGRTTRHTVYRVGPETLGIDGIIRTVVKPKPG